jgi:hypothetical protein
MAVAATGRPGPPPRYHALAPKPHCGRRSPAAATTAGAGLLPTGACGYEVRLDLERVDSRRFEQLVAQGGGGSSPPATRGALAALEEGLGLWRGHGGATHRREISRMCGRVECEGRSPVRSSFARLPRARGSNRVGGDERARGVGSQRIEAVHAAAAGPHLMATARTWTTVRTSARRDRGAARAQPPAPRASRGDPRRERPGGSRGRGS